MGPDAIMPSLVRWGVSSDSDLVYRCLAGLGAQPASGVGKDLGMPARRLASALEELRAVGIVAAPSARGGPWRALPPGEAVATLRRRRTQQARAQYPTVAPPPDVEGRHLADRTHTRRRIMELVDAERLEHLAMNPEPAFSIDAVTFATPLDRAMLARGVRLRMLGLPPSDGDTSSAKADEFARLGGGYRELPRLPQKLMVFDRRVAILAIDPGNLERGALEISQPDAVQAFVRLFQHHWVTATDPRRNGVPTIVLTPRESAIVALLAAGHTDESAAQQLRLSTRSVTYTLRGLMDRLCVENRFQLGLALGARHGLEPERRPGRAAPDQKEDEQ